LQYAVLVFEESIWLKKRDSTDIWADMYDYYMLNDKIIINEEDIHEIMTDIDKELKYSDSFKKSLTHKLTHRNLIVEFEVYKLNEKYISSYGEYFTFEDIESLPKPKIINDIFKEIMKKWFN
jgi:adenine-specific DNA glycosylase